MRHRTRQKKYDIFRSAMIGLGLVLAAIAVFYPTEAGIIFGYVLIGAALLTAIVFPTIEFIKHPREGMRALAGIVIIGLIFLISWAIADGDPVYGLQEGVREITAEGSVSRLSGAGINMALGMIGLTVLIFIIGEVQGFFN